MFQSLLLVAVKVVNNFIYLLFETFFSVALYYDVVLQYGIHFKRIQIMMKKNRFVLCIRSVQKKEEKIKSYNLKMRLLGKFIAQA